MMVKNRVRALLLSAIVVMGCSPYTAFAQALTTAEKSSLYAQSSISSQSAKKKTVYVITSVTKVQDDSVTGKPEVKHRYSYNSQGLVRKHSASSSDGILAQTYTYKAGKLKSSKYTLLPHEYPYDKYTSKYVFGKKGLLKKEIRTSPTYKCEVSYKGSSGRIKSYVIKSRYKYLGKWSYESVGHGSLSYIGKRVKTWKASGDEAPQVLRFRYDSKGNLKKSGLELGKRVYRYGTKGRVASYRINEGNKWSDDWHTVSYTYKAMKVSKKMASKVKAQQWAIVNDDLNWALGGYPDIAVGD